MQQHENDHCEEQCFHPKLVESVAQELLGSIPADELAQLFKALGDNTRIRILNALYLSELCVCDLTDLLGMNQSAVSHQLRVLRDARIVKSKKQGKNVLYSLDDEHVSGIICLGSEHVKELKR
jgi:ArsR family transcriptional regulator